MDVQIYPVSTIEECHLIERLITQIWGMDDRETVPSHLLITIAKEGGQLLLAYADEEPVGFAMAFLGRTETHHLKLVSHQVGILPIYQNKGIGYQLKLAQREDALAHDIDLISWTFDPLLSRNAYLNLHKLGTVSQTYLPNLYGTMRDNLNQGLPSDRLRVEWWLKTPHVANHLAGEVEHPPLFGPDCPLVNVAGPLDFQPSGTYFCQVRFPPDIREMEPDEARAWQQHLQQVLEALFSAGYVIIDLIHRPAQNYYLLQKDWHP